MEVIIESDVWEPNPTLYLFFFISCCLSIYYLPDRTRSSAIFDHAPSSSFICSQRRFLLLYSLSSGMQGLWAVFGEYEWAYQGISKEQIVASLCIGYAASLFVGTFLGMLSDLIGQRKVCLLFCLLHLFIAIWKMVAGYPSVWLASICLSLASTIFFFNFETWMVVEHDKLEQRQDSVNDMLWLMTFVESASFIGSQVLGNWLIRGREKTSLLAPSSAVAIMAFIALAYVSRGWREDPKSIFLKDYQTKLQTYIFGDKRVWLLSWTQATVHFALAVFWIIWAPTIVADGREVLLGLIYPCLLGAKMLGSTAFSWFFRGPLSLRTEECLVYACIVMGIVASIIAFDYQDIENLVMLFCIFQACVGLVLPSLARLRTMYVPNELRGGMMTLSTAPSKTLMLFFLIQEKSLTQPSPPHTQPPSGHCVGKFSGMISEHIYTFSGSAQPDLHQSILSFAEISTYHFKSNFFPSKVLSFPADIPIFGSSRMEQPNVGNDKVKTWRQQQCTGQDYC